MRFDKWHALRATAWALIWILLNPELRIAETWVSPERIGWLVGMYFVTGIILETAYRWLTWGEIVRNQAIRPECPDRPWICLQDDFPDDGLDVEVFCADGKVRGGQSIRRDDGQMGIIMSFTAEDVKVMSKNSYLHRPTHWRTLASDNNKKEKSE